MMQLNMMRQHRAGDLAEQELTAYSVTPEDVVRKLPDAIREILE